MPDGEDDGDAEEGQEEEEAKCTREQWLAARSGRTRVAERGAVRDSLPDDRHGSDQDSERDEYGEFESDGHEESGDWRQRQLQWRRPRLSPRGNPFAVSSTRGPRSWPATHGTAQPVDRARVPSSSSSSSSSSSQLERQLASQIMYEKMVLSRDRAAHAGTGASGVNVDVGIGAGGTIPGTGVGGLGRMRMFQTADQASQPVPAAVLSAPSSPRASGRRVPISSPFSGTTVPAFPPRLLQHFGRSKDVASKPAVQVAPSTVSSGPRPETTMMGLGAHAFAGGAGAKTGPAASELRRGGDDALRHARRQYDTSTDEGAGDSPSDSETAHAVAGSERSARTFATDGTSGSTAATSSVNSSARPQLVDVQADVPEDGAFLPACASAADAEIGRQMYAQEAYTAETISHEVQAQKADFGSFIDNLIALLKLRTDVLQTKLSVYKSRFRNVQILVFIGSALIALITGFRVMYAAFQEDSQHSVLVPTQSNATTPAAVDLSALQPGEILAFDLFIFVLSTSMGLLTTIATFRGWAKKADDMSTVYARSQMVVLALADSQLQVKFIAAPEQMQLLRSTFFAREFKMYADLMRTMADHITFRTLTKHLPAQYDLNVQFLRDDTEYQADLLNIFVENQTLLKEVAGRNRIT